MDMLQKYKKIADEFANKMWKHPDVEGVMHLGGIARQRADEYSDIDIAVFSNKKLKWLQTGEQETPEGYDLEVFNIAMDFGFENWDEIKKEAYQEGVIAFDRNGKVTEFMQKALEYPDDYRIAMTAELVFAIAWHGWIYSPFRNKTAKNYRWLLTEDLWFLRGDENNAFYTARYCLDKFIELLFVINRRWLPDYKWRYIRSKSLPWLPSGYETTINQLMFGEWSKVTWESQRKLFQCILDETIEHILDYMPEDWYSLI